MKQTRLMGLCAVMLCLMALHHWRPPQTDDNTQLVSAVAAIKRSKGNLATTSSPLGASSDVQSASLFAVQSVQQDVPGNAFEARKPMVMVPPPPPPIPAPQPSRVVARVEVVQEPTPPPPPPPPPVQVIGRWDDGQAPGVFLATPQGTLLARAGSVVMADYRVTAIEPQQISLQQASGPLVWHIPIPQVSAAR